MKLARSSSPSLLPSFGLRGALSGLLCAAVALAPVPALAGPAEPAAADGAAAGAAPKVTDGNVGLMRFTGDPEKAKELRVAVQQRFEEDGYTVKGVALDVEAAAKKVSCKGSKTEPDEDCLERIGLWLNKKGKQVPPYTYLVFGAYGSAESGQTTQLIIIDLVNNKRVTDLTATPSSDDLILPLMLPARAVTQVNEYITPPPPITPEEQQILANLDGGLTPEDMAAEAERIKEAEEGVLSGPTGPMDTSKITVSLKDDFKKYCRNEKRKKRTSKEDPKDLRPSCKLGPFFGYWQPRAWVALGLTAGGLAAMGILYGVGLAKRGAYTTAVDNLESSGATLGKPNQADNYTTLASEVASTGSDYKRFLVGGDIALATSVVLFGVLGIIIYQDRTEAKAFIKQEKALAGLRRHNFQIGPVFSQGFSGGSLGFRF